MRAAGLEVVVGMLIPLLAFGCAGQLPRLTRAQVETAAERWPGTTPTTLDSGRALYVAKCSGCHTLVLPNARPARMWPLIMDKMQHIAKLKDDDKEKILRFILAAHAGDP